VEIGASEREGRERPKIIELVRGRRRVREIGMREREEER